MVFYKLNFSFLGDDMDSNFGFLLFVAISIIIIVIGGLKLKKARDEYSDEPIILAWEWSYKVSRSIFLITFLCTVFVFVFFFRSLTMGEVYGMIQCVAFWLVPWAISKGAIMDWKRKD